MRGVIVDVPERVLEERHTTGADRRDEMWEGVVHMVPPASGEHQRFGTSLIAALIPIARTRGLVPSYETGLFRPGVDDDYRVPDQIYAQPHLSTDRGVDGPADLVLEIRSTGDETYEKLPFYAGLGVKEVLVAHPQERRVELFVLRGEQFVLVQPNTVTGTVRSDVLDATFTTAHAPEPRLRMEAAGTTRDV